MRLVLVGQSLAVVHHREHHELAGAEMGMGAAILCVQRHVGGLDREGAAVGHRVPRVDGQVDERLLDLRHVDPDQAQLRLQHRAEPHVFAQQALEDLLHPADHVVQVQDSRVDDLAPGEGEQLAGGLRGGVRRRGGLGAGRDVQFAEDVRYVDADRLGGDDQGCGDGPVRLALGHQLEHLQLAGRQRDR